MGKKIDIESIRSIDIDEMFNMTIPIRDKNSICWFETAVLDFKTAGTLLNNKVYCHSLFFMQQCVECIVKGILIENKIVNVGEIKKWSHSPEEAFSAFYKAMESQSELFFSNIKERILKEHGLESKLETTNSIINYYCQIYEDSFKKTTVFCNPAIALRLCVDAIILSLSFLLNSMQQNTRYPDIETCKLPSMLYDESETVVKHSSEILKRIRYVLNNVCPEFLINTTDK